MNNKAFISYSHKDRETAEKIAKTIGASCDIDVWIDNRLRGGESFSKVIATRISQSDYFVFVASANSVNSKWCYDELEYAKSEKLTIVAIWIEDVHSSVIPPEVKFIIGKTHYIYHHRLTDGEFEAAVINVFSDMDGNQAETAVESAVERESEWSSKYFLEAEKLAKIKILLSEEKKGRYSTCFESENAVLLGMAYELGIGTESDLTKAGVYYRAAIHAGNVDGKYLYATLKLGKCETEEEKEKYRKDRIEAAEQGSALALTYLGDDYYFGQNGFKKDLKTAYSYWQKAANESVAAMYYLAFGYKHGEIVEKDVELAYIYALQAAEKGFPRAFRILGFIYQADELFPREYEKAIKMFDEAFKRNDYLSVSYKGFIYGLLEDEEKRVECYEQALKYAEEGKIKSGTPFYRYGLLCAKGQGVPEDKVKAVEYYLKAAERKHSTCLKYVVNEIMRLEDSEKKTEFLKRAFELNCEGAALRLATIEKGDRKNNDLPEKAIEYYTSGAENGDVRCMVALIRNYGRHFSGELTKEQHLEALKWFEKFFADTENTYFNYLREKKILSSLYFAYGYELLSSFSTDLKKDLEAAVLQFEKALKENIHILPDVAKLAVQVVTMQTAVEFKQPLDIDNITAMLTMIEKYLEIYSNYGSCLTGKYDNFNTLTITLNLISCYNQLSKCYSNGINVKRDKLLAAKYAMESERLTALKNKLTLTNNN